MVWRGSVGNFRFVPNVPNYFRRDFLLGLVAATLIVISGHASAGPQVVKWKRFPETISPDGSYVLGWGDKAAAGDVAYSEMAYATPRADLQKMEGIQDYLMETRRGKAPLVLPRVEYFSGVEGHEAKHGMTFAWSPDSRGLLVIYEEPNSCLAMLWADPVMKRVTDVATMVELAARKTVRAAPGKTDRAKRMHVYYTRVAVVQPRVLTLDANFPPDVSLEDSEEEVTVRLKFKTNSDKTGSKLELIAGRVVAQEERREEPAFTDDGLEVELKDLSAKLRERLDASEKNALQKEQEEWLKQRFVLPTAGNKQGFTHRRVEELRIRLEELTGSPSPASGAAPLPPVPEKPKP